jgi:hypothetical protein
VRKRRVAERRRLARDRDGCLVGVRGGRGQEGRRSDRRDGKRNEMSELHVVTRAASVATPVGTTTISTRGRAAALRATLIVRSLVDLDMRLLTVAFRAEHESLDRRRRPRGLEPERACPPNAEASDAKAYHSAGSGTAQAGFVEARALESISPKRG